MGGRGSEKSQIWCHVLFEIPCTTVVQSGPQKCDMDHFKQDFLKMVLSNHILTSLTCLRNRQTLLQQSLL